MEEIIKLEKRIWEQISIATENRDSKKIQELNLIAQELERRKEDVEKIRQAVHRIEDKLEALGVYLRVTPFRGSPPVTGPGEPPVVEILEEPLVLDSPHEPSVVNMSEEPLVLDRPEEPLVMDTSPRSVSWEVTGEAIGRSILSMTYAKEAGLIPVDGTSFVVETSLGQVFKTRAVESQDRLKEKRKVRQFYEGAGIKAGDRVVWTEIRPLTYRLEKA
jgi:hypothetical protein